MIWVGNIAVVQQSLTYIEGIVPYMTASCHIHECDMCHIYKCASGPMHQGAAIVPHTNKMVSPFTVTHQKKSGGGANGHMYE